MPGTWDSGRNDWLRQHADDVIFHRQLMAEDMTMENSADLLTAQRQEDGAIVGVRVETKRDSLNLTAQQVGGMLHTLALIAPEQYLNTGRDETTTDDDMEHALRVAEQEQDDYRTMAALTDDEWGDS